MVNGSAEFAERSPPLGSRHQAFDVPRAQRAVFESGKHLLRAPADLGSRSRGGSLQNGPCRVVPCCWRFMAS